MTEAPFDLDRIGGWRALRGLVDEVLASGEIALKMYSGGAAARVQAKPDRSPVTEADRAVEERLRAYLERRFPGVGFFGEETGSSGEGAPMRFLVDPIDGTRAFIRGLPTWSILVALEAEGIPSIGIAYMPAAGDLFLGVRGHGADCNGRPCHVSKVATLDAALVSHGGLQQFTDTGQGEMLLRLSKSTYTCRGFADFDGYRQVLLGKCDAMVDPGIQPYDVGAAAVLVREAGGTFTSIGGEATIHGGSGLASNGAIHDELVRALRGDA